ncbi:MAG: hypothetical protein AB1486_06115 [Planctomycetota bacterium]
MKSDSPIVDEVRRRRQELSERYGHDLQRYAQHLREVEARNAARVVSQVTVVRPAEPSEKNS